MTDKIAVMVVCHAIWNGFDQISDETDEVFGEIPPGRMLKGFANNLITNTKIMLDIIL